MKTQTSKIHVDIDAALKRELKIIAAKNGKKLREIISIIVSEYVKKNKS